MPALLDTRILLAIGGLGLFLLGMLILTEGLRGLAGNSLRRWLARYTTTPATGALTGAITTALIQSSSATTVTAIGFVGAGLLTFSQALGIIFGANIGTTITGWLVAIGGFKLELGSIVMPLLLLGTMLRLFAYGRWSQIGWALAGFSLLFLGIETMQQGMVAFEGLVTPDDFPENTLLGRFKLVLIGIAITLVTQSSSAGVATALVALNTGAISFPQGAAMVIGMDVGTTFTTALAAIGGSTAMRRTGYAHVIYNILTGVLAFFLLGPFTLIFLPWAEGAAGNAQIGLVAFHSFFNTLGVLLVLPFTSQFASLIQDLIPESGPPLVRKLDARLLVDPNASSDAAIATITEIASANFSLLDKLVAGNISNRQRRDELARLDQALDQTRIYLEKIYADPKFPQAQQRSQAAMHGLDHLNRLLNRCRQIERVTTLSEGKHLPGLQQILGKELAELSQNEDWNAMAKRFDRLRKKLWRQRHSDRAKIIEAASVDHESPERTLAKLDSLRWVQRTSYHIWRILHYLDLARNFENNAGAKRHP